MARRVSSPTFVGRRHGLDRATAALARAREGRPAVLLIAGEAGVGKTRFVSEVANRARASGFRVLVGGCVQLGGEGLPFGAIIEALRTLPHDLPPLELDALVGSGRRDLARLMPDLAVRADHVPDLGSFDGSARGRLFEHLLRLLERLAERTPLLVIVEDIHWADRSALDLLDFLARNVRHGAITLVVTYRSDELHRRHPLLPFLAEIERAGRAERLELHRFDRAELSRQIEGILGAPPDPELVERILARSEGNAFYAEELLAAGVAGGRLPDTLREVLLARVAALSEPTQELLRIASAAGQRITPALLARVTGTDGLALIAAFREAVARQILQPWEGGPDDRYAFRHALVQEAVYGDLLPGERASLHGAFARALADEEQTTPHASIAAELAYHWQAAHDLPRAFDASVAAGIAAEASYASAEAQAHFERALDLWDQVPDAQARATLDRIELLRRAAIHAEGTALSRSIAFLRRAIALVDATTEPTRAGLLYERLGYDLLNTLVDEADALEAARQAVRLVPADPPSAARALVLAGLGRCLYFMHRCAESTTVCEEALGIARAVGARHEEGRALIYLSGNQVALGDVEAGMANVRLAREIATETGDVFGLGLALTWTTGQSVVIGRYEGAVAAGLESEAYAVGHGLAARFGATDLSYAAWALIMLGRWDEAADALDRAQTYGGIAQADVQETLLLLEALRGEFESAAGRVGRVRPHIRSTSGSTVPPGVAELALWRSDPLAARNVIQKAGAVFDVQPVLEVDDVGWVCALGIRSEADLATLARARRAEPELEEAHAIGGTLLKRMRSLADEVAANRPYYTPHAEAWLATCEAESSRLRGAPDPGGWAAAAARWEQLRMPYFQAYGLMREAEAALAARFDRRRALEVLTAARTIAVGLGAGPLLRAVDGFVARALGKRPAEAVPSPDQEKNLATIAVGSTSGPIVPSAEGLTLRERDVLALLAEGRSDGEIASALFITKKTASTHVAHLKGKLGAQSRVEIAVAAIGLGLAQTPSAGRE